MKLLKPLLFYALLFISMATTKTAKAQLTVNKPTIYTTVSNGTQLLWNCKKKVDKNLLALGRIF